MYVRELAFWQCVNLISHAIGKCEFKTFQDNREIQGDEYYRWNYAPNRNQCSSQFLYKLISKLYSENEVLVVDSGGQLLVADSFQHREYALYDDLFEQVTVGDFVFARTFTRSDVLYWRLHDKNMRPLVNGLYSAYKKLLDYSMKSYKKSRGMKGILSVDALAAGDQNTNDTFEKIKNGGFRTFADAENALLPLWKGMTYTDIGSKTYSNEGTRDIRAMIDDVCDFTARAICIPPALLSGNVQGISDALEQFLTFCIDPLCDMLSEEINRQLYGKKVLEGSYLTIDTKQIKHVDLLSVSTAIDKLISSGAFCINDIRKLVGEPSIEEDWANQHFITKNYATVQDLLHALEQNEMR